MHVSFKRKPKLLKKNNLLFTKKKTQISGKNLENACRHHVNIVFAKHSE